MKIKKNNNLTSYLSNRHWNSSSPFLSFCYFINETPTFETMRKNLEILVSSVFYIYIEIKCLVAKVISFLYLIKWYTWIISWGKYISMTFLKAKRCLTFNFMSIMKPSDHVRFWEAFVFHSTIDLKSYKRKNSVAIVTISVNYQTYMISI